MAAPEGTIKITADSELMKNQKQAVVMDPQQDFQVLQTGEGDAMFFSIGSDGVFYVTREVQKSSSGWNQTDLSLSLRETAGNERMKAKSFVVSQNPLTLAIDVALVMSTKGSDSLHLSRNNAVSSDGWAHGISWTSVPFDAGSPVPSPFVISDLYMLTRSADERTPGPLTWFVDIVSTPGARFRLLERYHIQPESPTKWVKRTPPNDVVEGSISSCLGRRQGDRVDGIYTLGQLGKSRSLVFTPTKNYWDPESAPTSARLDLPKGASAISSSSISSCSNKDGPTHLFVAADDGLYLFPPNQQKDDAHPILIVPSSPVGNTNTFAGATCLRSSTVGSRTAVWGLNSRADLVYATCLSGHEAECTSWSPPMRICSGASRFAFYLNRLAPANVLFAQVGTNLIQLAQGVEGIWRQRSITLPVTDVDDMVEATTFTTQIKCTDQNGMPAVGAAVRFESKHRVPLTINNSYVKINPCSPIDVTADGTGRITIVQETDALPAASFKLSCGDQVLEVDPQSKIAQRLSAVRSGADLSSVRIQDSNGNTRPLVPADVPQTNRDAIAKFLPPLLKARSSLATGGSVDTTTLQTTTQPREEAAVWGVVSRSGELHFHRGNDAHARLNAHLSLCGYSALSPTMLSTGGGTDWLSTSAGDLFQFLKDASADVEAFFIRKLRGVCEFIANISGQIYTVVIDSVRAISSAIEFVFRKIKVLFEDLVAWLGFLFNWADILRTHKVIKNLFKQYARNAVDKIDVFQTSSVLGAFNDLEGFLGGKSWENVQPHTETMSQMQQGEENDLPGADSPQSNWAVYHTNNGFPAAATTTTSGALTGVDKSVVAGLAKILGDAVQEEEGVLRHALDRIKDEIVGKIQTMSLIEVIRAMLNIVGSFLVGTAKNIVLKLLDLVKLVMSSLLNLLDAPLELPIISPMYRLITGGDSLSCLDVVCLIAAIPGTLVYKLTTNEVPFPDNAATNSLIQASSFSQLSSLLCSPGPAPLSLAAAAPPTAPQVSSLAKTVVGVLKICAVAVTAANVALAYFKRESGISGPRISALSIALFLAAGSPTIATNFVSIGRWTVVADFLLWTGFGRVCLENSGLLDSGLKDFAMPWVASLLGLVGLVAAIWGWVEKANPGPSDNIGLAGSIFSGLGSTLTAFTSIKMFPEAAPVVFLMTIGCAVAGGQLSAGSGVSLLNGA